MNFVDGNEILACRKITLLANISNSLEMQIGIKFSSKDRIFSSMLTVRQCHVWQIILRNQVKKRCHVLARFGSLICHLEHGEDG